MTRNLRLSTGKKLKSPKDKGTRPTTARVREAVMNLTAQKIKGSNWLDLFSGSGVMAFEALIRGATNVIAVEKYPKNIEICRENFRSINTNISSHQSFEVIQSEVIKWLSKGYNQNILNQYLNHQNILFDIVYLDPPYNSQIYTSTLNILLEKTWVKKDSIAIIECSSDLQFLLESAWNIKDQRKYGKTSLVFLTPPEDYLDDTDSRQPQTSQELLLEQDQELFHKAMVQSFSS